MHRPGCRSQELSGTSQPGICSRTGMGDMKTPDFDDLLAAFDIPDIDAKVAIQSESGDPDGNHSESSGGVAGKERSGCPNQKPGLSDPRDAFHDIPVVSVIVKNSVCTDIYESRKEENIEDVTIGQVSDVLNESDRSGAESPQVAHSLMPIEPLIHNGFKAISEDVVEPAQPSSQTQKHLKNDFWSPRSPKIAREGDESNTSDSPTNSSGTFSSSPASAPSSCCSNLVGLQSSKVDKDRVECPASPLISQTQSSNNSLLTGVQNVSSKDEESEAELDFGSSPLMIQESPDQQMSSPLNFPLRHELSRDLQSPSLSSASLPISNTQTRQATSDLQQPDSSIPPQAPQQNTNTTSSATENLDPPNLERYPEHIIEERDSPESPDPDVPNCPQWNNVLSTSVQELIKKQPEQEVPEKEEPMETGDQHIKCNNDRAEDEKIGDPNKEKPIEPNQVASVENSSSSAVDSRPLKVRIKTVKTPTGNVTRTVTRVASKGATLDSSKVQMGGRKMVIRPKRPSSVRSNQPQNSKTPKIPVSTLQDASSAMLFAASKAQKVTAASSVTKLTPSSSAISICSFGQKTVSAPSTKPASIVSNPGAVISRSQSSLVEAFNKILNSKNPLPSYQPDLSVLPRPEWGLGMPASGYRCLECGDTFALECSLARHYDRRSLRIEVTCNHCMKRLAFFNKCSLLLHAREHKEKGLVMQCSHLIMKPVSIEQMVGQQDTMPMGVLSTSSSLSGAKEETVQSGCPECKTPFSSKENLASHFQETEPGLDICCMQCSPPMPLWNSCSAAAHQRLHQKLPPFVCPECGLTCQSHSLNKHLYQLCLHYTRQLGYRCPCCQLVFGGVNSLSAVKNHMHTAHCEVFHKCPSCPMAFKSISSAEGHCNAQHPNLSDKAKQSKEIYKCVMCRTVFTQKALLNHHFDTHLGTQKVPVFKCLECNKLFTLRLSLLEHAKASHRKSTAQPTKKGSAKAESSDGEEWRREEEEEDEEEDRGENKSLASFNVQIWSCSECQTRYGDKESFISHMAKQHRKELKRFPCTLCESSFSSSSSLRRHFRVKHKGIKRSFYCQLCTRGKKSFSSKLVLEKHMQIHHGGQKEANAQNQVNSFFTDTADSSSEQDGTFNPVKARSHDSKVSNHSRALSGRPGYAQGCYRCTPCGYTSEDKQEFALHIQTHRGDTGKAQQCQQCGACFASSSSLSRHRFISHGMRDTDGDDQGMKAGDFAAEAQSPMSPSQVEEEEGKLSCKVCGRRFSKAADLSTHFRTHGMAFIRTYKAEKPN